jgi:hypothetical protein
LAGICRRRKHSSGCVFAFEVSEDLLDHRRFFDAGDDLDVTAAVLAGLDVDVTYRDVGQGREQDAEALKTRFRGCA